MRTLALISLVTFGFSQVACAKDESTSSNTAVPSKQQPASELPSVSQDAAITRTASLQSGSVSPKFSASDKGAVTPKGTKSSALSSGETQQEHIMIVLDSSGSMWGQIDGAPKRDIARQALRNVLSNLPSTAQVGLTVYGHRREGDCNDIEVLAEPGDRERDKLSDLTDSLASKGKTPLTSAVRQAAESLSNSSGSSTIVVVTDGIETCDADPCELGRELAATQVALKTHVIGFGLSGDEGRQVSCLANETGGLYFDAQNAELLNEALDTVVDDLVEPVENDGPATVEISQTSFLAGKPFDVNWTGPKNSLDTLTIRSSDGNTDFGRALIYREKDTSPATLRAPETKGQYTVHYLTRKGKSLAHAEFSVIPVPATITVTTEKIPSDTTFNVQFSGPKNIHDRIVMFETVASEKLAKRYVNRLEENKFTFRSPPRAGTYTLAYINNDATHLAQATIEVFKRKAAFTAPNEPITAGKRFDVAVGTGAGEYDSLQVLNPSNEKKNLYKVYLKRIKNGAVALKAPLQAGTYDIAYVDRSDKILERSVLNVVAPPATMEVQQSPIAAGQKFYIAVSEQHGDLDRLELAKTPSSKKSVARVFLKSAKNGQVRLVAPKEVGTYALRYMNTDDEVLASISVDVQ